MLTASCLLRMRCSDDAEKRKNAPQVFPGFPIIKLARHCGKITIFLKTVRFMGTVSGPAGYLCSQYFFDPTDLFFDLEQIFLDPSLHFIGGCQRYLFLQCGVVVASELCMKRTLEGMSLNYHSACNHIFRCAKSQQVRNMHLVRRIVCEKPNSDANTFIVYVGEGNP